MNSNTKDYRVTVKVRNNRILKAIESIGEAPGAKFCSRIGISYGTLNNLINLTQSPLTACGHLSDTATKLCDALGKLPEELWSNEQLYPLEKNFSELEVDCSEIAALMSPGDAVGEIDTSSLESAQRREVVDKALALLSPRERDVVRMRFWEDMTLEQVASRNGVTRERIRQIEHKALRKLRHPKSVKIFKDVAVDAGIDNVELFR